MIKNVYFVMTLPNSDNEFVHTIVAHNIDEVEEISLRIRNLGKDAIFIGDINTMINLVKSKEFSYRNREYFGIIGKMTMAEFSQIVPMSVTDMYYDLIKTGS